MCSRAASYFDLRASNSTSSSVMRSLVLRREAAADSLYSHIETKKKFD